MWRGGDLGGDPVSGKVGRYRVTSDGTAGGTRVFWQPIGKPQIELRGVQSASLHVGGSVAKVELVIRVRDVELDLEVLPEGVTVIPVESVRS